MAFFLPLFLSCHSRESGNPEFFVFVDISVSPLTGIVIVSVCGHTETSKSIQKSGVFLF